MTKMKKTKCNLLLLTLAIFLVITSCANQVSTNPVQIESISDQKVATSLQTQLKPQTLCPFKHLPINKKYYVDVMGKRIYTCCKPCLRATRVHPEKALQNIQENGEYAISLIDVTENIKKN